MTGQISNDIDLEPDDVAHHMIDVFLKPDERSGPYQVQQRKAVSRELKTGVSEFIWHTDEELGADQIQTSSWPKALTGNLAKLASLRKIVSNATFDLIIDFALYHRNLQTSVFGDFLLFLELSQEPNVDPEMFLAPNGMLVAEWYRSSRSHLDIEFAGGNKCFFGIFSPGQILEGSGSVSELARILSGHSSHPLKW